ncbi:MAG: hypothetical protein SFX72_05780 [Isosphaeraceae bacterium]|nr:hypothetical protein [Isosphaeraceae bacterium]
MIKFSTPVKLLVSCTLLLLFAHAQRLSLSRSCVSTSNHDLAVEHFDLSIMHVEAIAPSSTQAALSDFFQAEVAEETESETLVSLFDQASIALFVPDGGGRTLALSSACRPFLFSSLMSLRC